MRISDILRDKQSNEVATVGPTATVPELLALLAEKNVGALVVLENDEVVGIVSERDVVRRLHRQGREILDGAVSAIMTTGVITCDTTDDVDQIAATMTSKRIRHLPVVHGGKLTGIITIGDVVSSRISQLEQNSRHLEQYITG